jgi:hypothetical protein
VTTSRIRLPLVGEWRCALVQPLRNSADHWGQRKISKKLALVRRMTLGRSPRADSHLHARFRTTWTLSAHLRLDPRGQVYRRKRTKMAKPPRRRRFQSAESAFGSARR